MTKQFFAKVAAVAMIIAGSLLGSGIAYAQNRAISGTVVDASGAPVVGAAVVVVGNASIGAVTDTDGTVRLNVPAGSSIKAFTLIQGCAAMNFRLYRKARLKRNALWNK